MYQNRFDVNENTTLVIKVNGNLQVTGWDQPFIQLTPDMSRIQKNDEEISVYSAGDCFASVPKDFAFRVERAGGDVILMGVSRGVLEKVSGNLVAKEISFIKADKVGGDCVLQDVTGEVEIQKAGGNVQISGNLERLLLHRVGGDLFAQAQMFSGSAKVGGDVGLAVSGFGDEGVSIVAGGDIRVHVPADIQAVFEMRSGGEDIIVNVGDQKFTESESRLSFGEAGTSVSLEAGGSVILTDEPWQPVGMGAFPDPHADPHAYMGSHAFDRRIEEITERATRAAERATDRAARILEQKARAAERITGSFGNFRGPGIPDPMRGGSTAESAARSGASEEERLMILRMLQEKKISLEQAEQLLEALEGRK